MFLMPRPQKRRYSLPHWQRPGPVRTDAAAPKPFSFPSECEYVRMRLLRSKRLAARLASFEGNGQKHHIHTYIHKQRMCIDRRFRVTLVSRTYEKRWNRGMLHFVTFQDLRCVRSTT